MTKLSVTVGQHVARGQPIRLVSDFFGLSSTTIHLHFEIKEPITDGTATTTTFVPPYSSLVDAYQRLLTGST
jgi:murein DD-endopeptidase MepM/ murein hydrolase activator NlpD